MVASGRHPPGTDLLKGYAAFHEQMLGSGSSSSSMCTPRFACCTLPMYSSMLWQCAKCSDGVLQARACQGAAGDDKPCACRWGIEHTLDEVMEGPQVIKHMLNDENGLGRAYLGVRYATQVINVFQPMSWWCCVWAWHRRGPAYGCMGWQGVRASLPSLSAQSPCTPSLPRLCRLH